MNFSDQVKNSLQKEMEEEIVDTSKHDSFELELLEKGEILERISRYKEMLNDLKQEVNSLSSEILIHPQLVLLEIIETDIESMSILRVSLKKGDE